jgi:sugar phosphate isomerase/epimerase
MIRMQTVASLGTLLLMITLVGCDSGPRWDMGMQTYTFRKDTLVDAMGKVKQLELKKIEAYSAQKIGGEYSDVNFDHKASEGALEFVRDTAEKEQVDIEAYYFHALGKDEEETRRVFEFARAMDIDVLVGEPAADRLALVDDLAGEFKIKVAIHNHAKNPKDPDYKYWDPKEVMKLIERRSQWIGVCPDTGHWARSGLDPIEALRTYEGRIHDVHLKDAREAKKQSEDAIWGQGVGNLEGVLAELMRQGYDGLAVIEYENRPEDNMADVRACLTFYDETIAKLKKSK